MPSPFGTGIQRNERKVRALQAFYDFIVQFFVKVTFSALTVTLDISAE